MAECSEAWKTVELPVAGVDDYIGKLVASKYRVEMMLGEGGMGKVYKATQVALDKPVVLKVLRQALLSDERTVARFQREAKAASRLNHPNSISVMDFGQTAEGALYIAMEFVQGVDLHALLVREWPILESRAIRIMSQVLAALADAHNAGVIHRDLKPENIMVEQRRGEADFVKVLDFGIAKIIDGTDDDGPALTRAGFVCGTPAYMSPEQARGAKLDRRSDLYAVGVILYQLMVGQLPFESDSAIGFATKHLNEVPLAPTARIPTLNISPALEALIMRALSKHPDQRPQTAEQFRAELLAIEKARRLGVEVGRGVAQLTSAAEVARRMSSSGVQSVDRPPDELTHKIISPLAEKTLTQEPAIDDGVASKNSWTKLVVTALAVFGVVGMSVAVWQTSHSSSTPYVAPPNAPRARGAADLSQYTASPEKRRPLEKMRLAGQGDDAFVSGKNEEALSYYLEAWQADPEPQLALKIGELYFQMGKSSEANLWWDRFRADAPSSRALGYIEQVRGQ